MVCQPSGQTGIGQTFDASHPLDQRIVHHAKKRSPDPPANAARGFSAEGIAYNRLITEDRTPAPNPLSILTTPTVGAQELSIPRSAATPPKLAP